MSVLVLEDFYIDLDTHLQTVYECKRPVKNVPPSMYLYLSHVFPHQNLDSKLHLNRGSCKRQAPSLLVPLHLSFFRPFIAHTPDAKSA
jgi:hypothetical protein